MMGTQLSQIEDGIRRAPRIRGALSESPIFCRRAAGRLRRLSAPDVKKAPSPGAFFRFLIGEIKKTASAGAREGAGSPAPGRRWHRPHRRPQRLQDRAGAVDRALEMANPAMDKAALFLEAIRTFVRVRAAQRLAVLGGAAPTMLDIPRRRAEPSQ